MEEQKQRKKLSLGLRLFIILMTVTLLLMETTAEIILEARPVAVMQSCAVRPSRPLPLTRATTPSWTAIPYTGTASTTAIRTAW